MSQPPPDRRWLHPGDELRVLGEAVIRVVKTRSGEVRLEVVTSDVFEWRLKRDVDGERKAS